MSLRKAINEMCTQCIYDKRGDGGKLQQISACTAMQLSTVYRQTTDKREGVMRHRPKWEGRTLTLTRRAYKELCRAAAYHRMSTSVYVECLALKFPMEQKIGREEA